MDKIMWPFKKKEVVEDVQEEAKGIHPETITIYADDTGMRRAEIAMRHAGFAINDTLYNQLPWIAQVFDAYKKLDIDSTKIDSELSGYQNKGEK